MNKIYKLVFNRRIGAFVAVSEAAKSVTKGAVVVGTVSLGGVVTSGRCARTEG